MKKLAPILGASFLGITIGWVIGYLRIPYFERNLDFTFGLITGISITSLIILTLAVSKFDSILRFWRKNRPSNPIKYGALGSFLIFGALIALSSFLSHYMIFTHMSSTVKSPVENESIKNSQYELLLSTKKSNALILLANLKEEIRADLRSTPGSLSKPTINGLKQINSTFIPDHPNNQDRVGNLSPERGQLLLMLSTFSFDTLTFSKIKSSISFQYADLQGAILNDLDLSGIDLRNANLNNANLSGTNLAKALLTGAQLNYSDLTKSDLTDIHLENSSLKWSKLDSSIMVGSIVSGSDISNSRMRYCDLRNSDFRWSNLSYTLLNGSNISKSDWSLSQLNKASFVNCKLNESSLIGAHLENTNFENCELREVDLRTAKVESLNWIDELENLNIKGHEEIKTNYEVESNPSSVYYMKLVLRK